MVSARLLAAGTPRRERLEALSLLGLLFDHADAGGRVRVPLDDLAGEFDLPRAQVEAALDALVRVGVVGRDADGVVLSGPHPPLAGSLRLSAFLANVAAVLDDQHAEPVPPAPPRSPVLLADASASPRAGGRRRQRRVGPRQPALAALALTGVVLLATLGPPSEPPTRLRNVDGPPAAATPLSAPAPQRPALRTNPWVSWPVSSPPAAAGQEPVAGEGQPSSGGEGQPSPGAERQAADASTVPGEEQRRSDDKRPAATETEATAGPEDATARRRGPAGAQNAPQGPRAGAPAPPSRAESAPPVRCPAGAPQIVVDDAAVRRAGIDVVPALGVPTTSVTEVRGTLTNPTPATAVVRAFEVVLGSGASAVAVAGPPGPVVLAPGGRQEWTVRTPSSAEPGTAPAVEGARIVDWGWQEAELVRACPT
ncbi:MAG TPA: hypothetical protein VGV63_11575 [Acidimicrobiales bacterium]|nr:hypothetical protein [Acidimicrobiales bacterium]